MKKISYLYYFLFLLMLLGCQKVIELDLNKSNPSIVIDALITNLPGPYYVKLSKTASYFDPENIPTVQDAIVIISDNAGNSDTLREIKKLDSLGTYVTQKIKGVEGRTYVLTVLSEGQTYIAQSSLPALPAIDSIAPILGKSSYRLFFYFKDQQNVSNYYLWKFYKNDTLLNAPSRIFINNDTRFGNGEIGIRLPYSYNLKDSVIVEFYSLTKEGYSFYDGLNKQLHNDGGMFNTPPSNAPGNFSNNALGFFQASSLEKYRLVIK